MKTIHPRAIFIDFFGTIVEEIHLPVKKICDRVCQVSNNIIQQPEFNLYWVKIFTRLCEESFGHRFILLKEIEERSLQATIDHFQLGLDAHELAFELTDYRSHPLLYSESRRVLEEIDIPRYLVTNIDNSVVNSALQFTGLEFDRVITSQDCRAYKPRPEVFQTALTASGCQAAEVLHVGDSWQGDVEGARSLGIPVLWIDRRGKPLPQGVNPADYRAADLNGLSALLGQTGT